MENIKILDKAGQKEKRMKKVISVSALLIQVLVFIIGIIVFLNYHIVKEKIVEHTKIEKQTVDKFYIFLGGESKISIKYNGEDINTNLFNLIFSKIIFPNDVGEDIYVNNISGKSLNKKLSLKDLNINNFNGIVFNIDNNGKESKISLRKILNIDILNFNGDREVKIIGVNGKKLIVNKKINFLDFVKKIQEYFSNNKL